MTHLKGGTYYSLFKASNAAPNKPESSRALLNLIIGKLLFGKSKFFLIYSSIKGIKLYGFFVILPPITNISLSNNSNNDTKARDVLSIISSLANFS